MYGKTIELFLVNGTADSLITAELSNWNGKAIKIPRTEVASCDREDLQNAGVYFLFCQEEEKDSVYIGEAENVLSRLNDHIRDYKADKEKYYWNTAVVFIGRDLNKALIRYLENRFVEIAKESGRYTVLTKNTFKNTVMKESQIATMEEFIDNVKVLISTLGYKVLVSESQVTKDTTYLYCKGSGGDAKGYVSSGGFTILKGSKVSDHIVQSFETRGKSYYELRKKLENEKIIQFDYFMEDYEFTSPSAASAIVLGRTSNGNHDWKTIDGKKLKEID